jgi:apolipoprotein N-acyltransferase
MKKQYWILLTLSAILYVLPFLYSAALWWLIFIFPVPLLYITCTENLSFIHGYIWGIVVFSLHLHAGILIVANLAGDWWWIGLLMGIGMILYQALMPAVLFWLATKTTLLFAIKSLLIRILLWTAALALFIFWTDQYCMWLFDMNGYPFMHPLLPLAQYPSLLQLLPIMGKQLLLLLFLLVPASIVLVISYKNGVSILLCIIAFVPWIWSAIHQPKYANHPNWYKKICSLPCMIRAHTTSGAVRILTNHIKKCITDYPEASIIIMPESALDIVDCEFLYKANIILLNRSELSSALTLNLLKGFLERSRIPFNKFRVSANNRNISGCLKGMCYVWHRCKKKPLHLIFGACFYENGNYYNSLYWLCNDSLQARFDKKHVMLMTERLANWMNTDWLRKIYFKDDISMTPSCNERKLLQISESVAFVPYICSELFFNEYPDDCYADQPIIAIINDTLLIDSYMQDLLLLMAKCKAIQWQRDIVYVAYGACVFIDKQAKSQLIGKRE